MAACARCRPRLSGEWQRIEIIRAGGEQYSDIRPLGASQCLGGGGAEWPPGIRTASAAAAASGYETYLDPDYWQGAVDEALRQALVNLTSVPAPAGEMTVVLGPGWPGILLHEAIGHGLEGDFNRKKTSAFAGLLGERVAAPGVTVVDDGTIDGRRGSLSIDDEGTPTSSHRADRGRYPQRLYAGPAECPADGYGSPPAMAGASPTPRR